MSCDETKRELRVRSAREFHEIDHLGRCAPCRALADRIAEQEEAMYTTLTGWVDRPRTGEIARTRRTWGGALLALAAVGALWIGLGGPGPEVSRNAAVPVVVRPAPTAERIETNVGSGLVVSASGPIASVTVDPGVAGYRLLGDPAREVHVFGLAAGETALAIRRADRPEPVGYTLVVGPRLDAVRKEDEPAALRLARGATKTVRPPAPPVAVSSADPAVATGATRDGAVEIRAVGAGVTDIVIAYAEGPPHVYVVEVGR